MFFLTQKYRIIFYFKGHVTVGEHIPCYTHRVPRLFLYPTYHILTMCVCVVIRLIPISCLGCHGPQTHRAGAEGHSCIWTPWVGQGGLPAELPAAHLPFPLADHPAFFCPLWLTINVSEPTQKSCVFTPSPLKKKVFQVYLK